MTKKILDTRIPTILGIVILLVGLGVTSFLARTGVNLESGASLGQAPKAIRISNITGSSFTVSYVTDQTTIGAITLGQDKNVTKSFFDDQIQNGQEQRTLQAHSITVKDLHPQTQYSFSITSGQTTFLDKGAFFTATTGPPLTPNSFTKTVTGKVIMPDGTTPNTAIVYIKTDNSQTLSALLQTDGHYSLQLNALRGEDLSSFLTLDETQTLRLEIVDATGTSHAAFFVRQTNPVPTIILTKDYDFTIDTSPLASSTAESLFSKISEATQDQEPKILTPKKNEGLTDQKPVFKGIASPGAEIKITIHSTENVESQIKADRNGNWTYHPTTSLSPGEHTISITTLDPSGILKTITQSFTVYAAGNQVSESATPSATPKITPTTTPSVVTITPIPTTPIPILTPTSIPAVTTTPPQISNPGNSLVETASLLGTTATALGIIVLVLSFTIL